MNREEEMFNIVEAMEQYGGSFVKALANLYRLADPINKRLLETTFKHYFEDYKKFVGEQ